LNLKSKLYTGNPWVNNPLLFIIFQFLPSCVGPENGNAFPFYAYVLPISMENNNYKESIK